MAQNDSVGIDVRLNHRVHSNTNRYDPDPFYFSRVDIYSHGH